MLAIARSQATCKQDDIFTNMEQRFIEMEEQMKKMTFKMEVVQWQNKTLRQRTIKFGEVADLSQI